MTFRPALRPGAPLLRRDATHLQVGTSPGTVIADRPGLVALLRLLDGGRDVDRLQELVSATIPELDVAVRPLLTELQALGVVVDVAATDHLAVRRARHQVRIEATPGTNQLVTAMTALLTPSGFAPLTSPEPDLLVIVSHGEAPRSRHERAALLGVDHLPIVIDENRVRIGPLVRPGRTPCLNCHDLHRTDWDPAWPALLDQMDRAVSLVRYWPLDALTTQAAAIESAAEVIAHADGRPIRTIGQCLVIGPEYDERATWPITFHHRCSCDLLNAA